MMHPFRLGRARVLLSLAILSCAATSGFAQDCEDNDFANTYDLIQAAVFERNSCTNQICHGASAAGGLDLRANVSYDAMIDVPAQSVVGYDRVVPGQAAESLLFLNLAGKTLPDMWHAPLRAMPLDPVPALSENEVEAIRLWIELGAPRDGVIPGTGELLDACLPAPEPISIKPLEPPAPGTGVQVRMPRWSLAPQSEREVCMATYYDFTDEVPEWAKGPDGTTFRYKFHETRQDPLSHHLVPISYEGAADVDSSTWPTWRCDASGDECDPKVSDSCPADQVCATEIRDDIGCIAYGPGDGGVGLSAAGISVTQETAGEFPLAGGVYEELPVKGILLWSSHAFNLTDAEGSLHSRMNFEFAPAEEQQVRADQIFAAQDIFKMEVPAFETQEVCSIFTLEENTHVFEFSSHTHRHGKRWRTFHGAFTCEGGPANGEACSPLGYDFASPDICQGAPCTSYEREHVGDCDVSDDVTVDEVITSVNIGLGQAAIEACPEADGDRDYRVTVDEILRAVTAALNGIPAAVARDPQESLFYVSNLYSDPLVLRPDEPTVFRGTFDERSLTYCGLYDNGFIDPSEVKMRATSPTPPVNIGFPLGGPCDTPTHCTEGKFGERCSGRTERARNASCDSAPGAGDGFCDACTVLGGVTTEDEMFILLGRYFVPPR